VLFLTLAIMFSSLMLVGANTNHLDIAPRYAGVLFGVTNLANTLPGIIGPQVAKAIAIEVGHYIPVYSYIEAANLHFFCSQMLPSTLNLTRMATEMNGEKCLSSALRFTSLEHLSTSFLPLGKSSHGLMDQGDTQRSNI